MATKFSVISCDKEEGVSALRQTMLQSPAVSIKFLLKKQSVYRPLNKFVSRQSISISTGTCSSNTECFCSRRALSHMQNIMIIDHITRLFNMMVMLTQKLGYFPQVLVCVAAGIEYKFVSVSGHRPSSETRLIAILLTCFVLPLHSYTLIFSARGQFCAI